MAHNEDLSDFLRARRAALSPESAGLTPSGVRRVPGLRREELAQLAGVSVDYYTRLEQGRHITPSPGVLDAIAEALLLDDAERSYLHTVARPAPVRQKAPRPQHVRAGIMQLLDTLGDTPAFLQGRRTDILAINPMGRAVFADFPAMPPRERNVTRWMILDEAAQALFVDWSTVAPEVVGTLRMDAAHHPNDERTAQLVGELSMRSAQFRRWWADQKVVERTYGRKRLRHPLVGDLEFNTEAMELPGDPDQLLLVFMPSSRTRTAEALSALASLQASGRGHSAAPGHRKHVAR